MKNKIITKFKDFWRVNPAPSCNVENDAGRIVFISNYFRNKLSGILGRCWIKRNQKLMFSFFVLFVVGGLLNATAVHAIPEVITDFFSDIGGDILGGLIQLISGMLMFLAGLCIKATLFFWEYFMELAGYNDFMNAPPVKIGWIMIRDLANMFFIVALMVIAIGTVLGVEQYEWKKSLVKLIFAAIFINFSKLILQLVLDFTGIIMQTFLIAFKGQSGNLIKIFSLNQITELLNSGGGTGSFNYKLFIASVVALTMAMLVMLTTGAYLVVMIGRMIVLWMLMIISPLAFILSAFPFGKQYASEFWKNFFNYAMVGPIMVFFSWLAFASLQTGRISTEINLEVDKLKNAGTAIGGEIGEESAISINQASTWENLASYFIALGFFVVGITMVGRMGVVGGGMVSKAMDFTKKVATIASGYAAGRYLVDRGKKGVMDTVGDYAKLGWGATGDRLRHAKGFRQIPILGGAGAEYRKANLGRLKESQDARSRHYKAEGPKGLSSVFAPKKERIAKLDAESTYMEGKTEDEKKRHRAEATEKMFRNDHREFANSKVSELEARLDINFKKLDESDPLRQHYDEYKKQIENDPVAAVDAVQDLEEALSKDERYGDKLSNRERREIDRKAAKGTFMISKELEEQYAEEKMGDEKSRKNEIAGFLKYGYEKNELKSLEKAFDDTRRDIEVTINDGDENVSVSGALFDNMTRITGINGYQTDYSPVGSHLVVHHRNEVGAIGKIGTAIGDVGINIAYVKNVSRGGNALTLVTTDRTVEGGVIDKITGELDPHYIRQFRVD